MRRPLSLVPRLLGALGRQLEYNLICLRSKATFLRRQGARIGRGCDLITDLVNFGTEPYLITIGDRTTITGGVKFATHDASTRLFRDRVAEMNRFGNVFGPIAIGSNCFVGLNVILLANTRIGDNSIVGAGAVVKGSFPDNSVLAGVPARRICSLEEYLAKIQKQLIPLRANTRKELRLELTERFFPPGRR